MATLVAGITAATNLVGHEDVRRRTGPSGSMDPTPSASAVPTAAPSPSGTPSGSAGASREQRATVRAARRTVQAFLDAWAARGIVVASHEYSALDQQVSSGSGGAQLSSGKVEGATLSSWESPDHFTLEVQLDLHFHGDPLAWNDGSNDRFITVTRDGAGYRLDFATSP